MYAVCRATITVAPADGPAGPLPGPGRIRVSRWTQGRTTAPGSRAAPGRGRPPAATTRGWRQDSEEVEPGRYRDRDGRSLAPQARATLRQVKSESG